MNNSPATLAGVKLTANAKRGSLSSRRRASKYGNGKQAMKQVLGIRVENARIKVTPPLAVAPLAQQEEDMRWLRSAAMQPER